MEAMIDAGIDKGLVVHLFFPEQGFVGRPGRVDAFVELGELQHQRPLDVANDGVFCRRAVEGYRRIDRIGQGCRQQVGDIAAKAKADDAELAITRFM